MAERQLEMETIACNAPYGSGGLGRHLTQLVEEAREAGKLGRYFATAVPPGDPAGEAIPEPLLGKLVRVMRLRFSPGWTHYLRGDLFDRAVATRLPGGEVLRAFSYQSRRCLEQARRAGYRHLLLESASVHADRVARQQARAERDWDLESGWLNEALRRKALGEYARADAIYVTSGLSRATFLEAGVPEGKLRLRCLQIDPRYRPAAARPEDGVFRVVYAGALTVLKGVPVLLEAASHLPRSGVELTLVGGWSSRGMRRYLAERQARDPRLRITSGDPLPHLQRADVFVHPSYTDGFGYAPMEALACGVPLIVSDETGMQEHVREGVDGYVVPTGSWQAILERLDHLMRAGKPCRG